MQLCVNMLLERVNTAVECWIDRILWISPDQRHLVLFRMNDAKALPYERSCEETLAQMAAGELRIVERDPYVLLETAMTASAEHLKRCEAAWQCIAPVVALPHGAAFSSDDRGPIIQKIASTTGTSKRMIYWYLRRYWQGGQRKNALLPRFHKCGAPGRVRNAGGTKRGRPRKTAMGVGINIGPSERELFEKGVKAFYENPANSTKMTLREAFERTLGRFFSRGYDVGADGNLHPALPPAHELPTYKQFRYWFHKQRNLAESLIARDGRRKYKLNWRGLGGDAASIASGPGAVYQIDSTKSDVYLVSSFDRNKVVGRATVYLVVDVFSGLIAGFDASFENAQYVSAALAIENAASDKVAFCHQHGISISRAEWPCQHLPEALWADRGELISKVADHLTEGLNIRVCNVPPYRADLKPFVERAFKTVNDGLIHKLPGAVVKDRERGDRDYRLEARLTLAEFQQALIHFILFYNGSRIEGRRPREFMVADNVESRPNAVWDWGIKNRSGHLHTLPADLLRVHLLPGGEASVTEKGILFDGLYYGCERAVREQWNARARVEGREKVAVAYDPRRAETLYLRIPNSDAIEPCTLLPSNEFFAQRSWKEVEFYFSALADQKETSKTTDLQRTTDYLDTVDSIVAKADASTNAAQSGTSKQAKIKGIRQNRKEERERERERLASHSSDNSRCVGEGPSNVVPLTPHIASAPPAPHDYVPARSNLALLRQQRDKVKN